MADYVEWNRQIIIYFTESVQRGSAVFISIDEEALQRIGSIMGIPIDRASSDFLTSITTYAVVENTLQIWRFSGRASGGVPNGIGFLAVMVLAASRMTHEVEADVHYRDYFKHLRSLLNLPQEEGRPGGMEIRWGQGAPEEYLWREWNIWLQEHGLLPTAKRGEGPQAYVNYPISQALLRRIDRDCLCRIFREHSWTGELVDSALLSRIRRSSPYLTKHLQELLNYRGAREIAVRDAIYDEYVAYIEDPSGVSHSGSRSSDHSPVVRAGLYRGEDDINGNPSYYLYPRAPRGRTLSTLTLKYSDESVTIGEERPGWLMPWLKVDEQMLSSGVEFQVVSPNDLLVVRLPSQSFWVLVADPESSDAHVFASWGNVLLGTPFLILCKQEWLQTLNRIREERLIEWRGEPRPISSSHDWWEVQDCLALSELWTTHADDSVSAFYEALRPQAKLNVHLSGGLRVSEGWLVDYGPQITVVAFPREADVQVINVQTEAVIREITCQTNQALIIEWNEPGDYRIEVSCAGESTQRLVKLIDWNALTVGKLAKWQETLLGGSVWRGALKQEVS